MKINFTIEPKWVWLILMILIGASHFFFLNADADAFLSYSRAPHTDEGIYTYQLRNFLNHGEWDIDKGGALLKTPVFTLINLPLLAYFGDSRITLRIFSILLLTLSFVLLGWSGTSRIMKRWFPALLMLPYPIYAFSHLGLSDTYAMAFMLLSISAFFGAFDHRSGYLKSKKLFLIASILVQVVWLIKVQYIYLTALLPLWAVAISVYRYLRNEHDRDMISLLLFSFAIPIITMITFYLFWYHPHEPLFDYVLEAQSAQRIPFTFAHFRENLGNQWDYYFVNGNMHWLRWMMLPAVFLTIQAIWKRRIPLVPVWLFVLVWLILEFHKLGLTYLPTRYLLTTYLAMGMFAVLGWQRFSEISRLGRILGWFLMIGLIWHHIVDWRESLRNRSYEQKALIEYVSANTDSDDVIYGGWAAPVSWGSEARTYQLVLDLFNHEEPISALKPTVVIEEPQEKAMMQVYLDESLDLEQMSDSTRSFMIRNREVRVYWLD